MRASSSGLSATFIVGHGHLPCRLWNQHSRVPQPSFYQWLTTFRRKIGKLVVLGTVSQFSRFRFNAKVPSFVARENRLTVPEERRHAFCAGKQRGRQWIIEAPESDSSAEVQSSPVGSGHYPPNSPAQRRRGPFLVRISLIHTGYTSLGYTPETYFTSRRKTMGPFTRLTALGTKMKKSPRRTATWCVFVTPTWEITRSTSQG